jgi:16S rRNA processing protein RimM
VAPDAKPSFITIARIARTRGNRGEILADLYTDYPDRFDALDKVWLKFDDGRRQPMALEGSWEHRGRRVMKFAGVDSIGSAESFVGCWVEVPADQAIQLPDGTYYDHDLVGCVVRDVRGNRLGVVIGILHIEGNAQLVVADDEREHLIPAVQEICIRISIEEKQIVLDPPEGLMDLE